MTGKSVHIVQDISRPEGGHAIIRIDGVWLLQEKATFRIEPLDKAMDLDDLDDWPKGDISPMDVRTTSRGIELLVGPSVVDAADLLPGTPIILSVPAADVLTELRWPDLKPSRSGSRGLAQSGRAQPPVVAASALSYARPAANGAAKNNGLAELQTRPRHERPEAPSGLAAAGLPGMMPPGKEANKTRDSETVAANLGQDAATPVPTSTGAKAPVPTPGGAVGEARKDAIVIPTQPRTALQKLQGRAPSSGASFMSSPLTIFSIGLVATAIVLGAAWINSAPVPEQQIDRELPDLAAIFAVGKTSPRGIDASAFDRDDALQLANQFVHGIDREADKAEAAFWLRKALSLKLSNEQMTWALTQLGTIYASPPKSAQPDYRSAMMLWEMAGANGDAVALCFVGQLHEFGLGVPTSKDKARRSYERADRMGGCPGLDAALLRVKGE